MFAPDHKGHFPILEDGSGPVFDVFQGHFRTAETQFQIPAVEYGAIGQVLVLVGTVGLQSEAFVADGGRSEPGAGPEAGGRIKGRPEQDNLGLFIGSVAGQERLHIIFQHP